MKTLKDLGCWYKETYPGEYDLSDEEVGRIVKEKYPNDYNDFEDTQLVNMPNRNLAIQNIGFDSTSLSHVGHLRSQLKPNNGWFSAWMQTIRSERNIKLLEVLTRNEIAIINHGEVLERAARSKQSEINAFESYLQEHQLELMGIQAKAMMLKNSVDLKLPVEYYGEYRKEELLTDLRIKEYIATEGNSKKQEREYEDLKHARELEKIEAESKRKMKEYEEKARIDFEKEEKIAEAKLNFAMKANHLSRHMKIAMIQDAIDQEYIKIAEIDTSTVIPDAAKPSIIANRQRIIDKWMKEQDEVQ